MLVSATPHVLTLPPAGRSPEQLDHFSQIVWKDTKRVGCVWTKCPEAGSVENAVMENYVSCNYWPPGNVMGEASTNVGPKL